MRISVTLPPLYIWGTTSELRSLRSLTTCCWRRTQDRHWWMDKHDGHGLGRRSCIPDRNRPGNLGKNGQQIHIGHSGGLDQEGSGDRESQCWRRDGRNLNEGLAIAGRRKDRVRETLNKPCKAPRGIGWRRWGWRVPLRQLDQRSQGSRDDEVVSQEIIIQLCGLEQGESHSEEFL